MTLKSKKTQQKFPNRRIRKAKLTAAAMLIVCAFLWVKSFLNSPLPKNDQNGPLVNIEVQQQHASQSEVSGNGHQHLRNPLHSARSTQAKLAAVKAGVPDTLLTDERLAPAPISIKLPANATQQTTLNGALVIPDNWPPQLDPNVWLSRPPRDWYPALRQLYLAGDSVVFELAANEFRKRYPNDPVDAFLASLTHEQHNEQSAGAAQ